MYIYIYIYIYIYMYICIYVSTYCIIYINYNNKNAKVHFFGDILERLLPWNIV